MLWRVFSRNKCTCAPLVGDKEEVLFLLMGSSRGPQGLLELFDMSFYNPES